MLYLNRKIEFRITGILLAVVLCLAAIPAVSAGTYSLSYHTPDGHDAPIYYSGDEIHTTISGLNTGDDKFTWNFYSDDLILEDGHNKIELTAAELPIGFVTDGTTQETFITKPASPTNYHYVMALSGFGGTDFYDPGVPGVTKKYNLRKGTYSISAESSTASPTGVYSIDWTIQGGKIATSLSGKEDTDFVLTVPNYVKSGHLWITVTDNSGSEPRQVSRYEYRIGGDPVTTTTTAPVTEVTTIPEGPSDSGGGGVSEGPQAGPLENGSFMMLKHDASGNLIADYHVDLDSAYGFTSALELNRPLTVLDSYGTPVDEIKINTIDPNAILDLTRSNVFTFSGYAVECEPPGTQFTNGFALLTVTLTDAQWAAALAAANGNTGAMTFKTYDETTGEWVDVPTIVDPVSHTITAQISHFSMYGLFYGTEASTQTFGNLMAPTTNVAAQQAPVETEATQQAPATTTKSPALPGIVVIGVVGLVAYFVVRKKE